MAHTISDKAKLLNRVHRVQGQLAAVERALNDESDCDEVLRMLGIHPPNEKGPDRIAAHQAVEQPANLACVPHELTWIAGSTYSRE